MHIPGILGKAQSPAALKLPGKPAPIQTGRIAVEKKPLLFKQVLALGFRKERRDGLSMRTVT
jgi:hypothetical protein